jgi:type II secretory ATPase GspE/PulE/Tfp pilus assembly ATPase PilB-like protein
MNDLTHGTAIHDAVTTLSGLGEPYEADSDLAHMLCLTSDGVLHIATGYGADHFVLAYAERVRRKGLKIVERRYCTPEDIKRLYGKRAVKKESSPTAGRSQAQLGQSKHDQVVSLLRRATDSGASDIHFKASPNGHHVRFRVHGDLETVETYAGKDGQDVMSAIFETMCETKDNSYRPDQRQDARLKTEFVTECGLFGARVATRPSLNGPGMTMRMLYDSGKQLTLEDIGYLPSQIAAFKRLVQRTDGMVFLTGATGSGKSTSIQALLSLLMEAMQQAICLRTVEDPVEYRIPGADQSPLGFDEAWHEAITNLMRLDPDVLLIGEVRDRASLLAALQSALTGHMTWTTLHVQSAMASFQRMHDLGADENLLFDPALIKALVNQSLVRELCPKCKTPYLQGRDRLLEDQRQRIEQYCVPEHVHLRGEGCSHCKGRGVVGRSAVAEIVQPDLAFMRVMRSRGKAEAQAFWVREQGGITKTAHLVQRINEGRVDPIDGERDASCPLDEEVTLGVSAHA